MILMRCSVLVLISTIIISGCVLPFTPTATEKILLLKMDASPREVFSQGTTTISVDIENQNVKTLRDVNVDIFETGSLVKAGECTKNFGDMDKNDFKTFACNLKAPKVERPLVSTVWARAKYKSTLSAVQTFDIISQTEAETRKRTGKSDGQKSFSFNDNNLELTMELSNSPLIDAAGKKEFVSFAIKNIGNGFVEKLGKDSITIKSSIKAGNKDILECNKQDISISGKEFPKFTCAINLQGDVVSFITAEISINIDYTYEIRDSIDVKIVK